MPSHATSKAIIASSSNPIRNELCKYRGRPSSREMPIHMAAGYDRGAHDGAGSIAGQCSRGPAMALYGIARQLDFDISR
jgi:hypothetical protein